MKVSVLRVLSVVFISILMYSCGSDKSNLLIKDWKATELTLGETKLSADDLGGMFYNFKADSSFSYTESGTTDTGKWILNADGTQITLTFKNGGHTVVQNIAELSSEKLVISYEDHGMKRNVVLVPNTAAEVSTGK